MARGKGGRFQAHDPGTPVFDTGYNDASLDRLGLNRLPHNKERAAYEKRVATTILAIVGGVILAVLFWLESKGY